MKINPLLNKLGYADMDRLVIIHEDDVGMCLASVQAFKDLWVFGTVSSGSIMAPCPWFSAAAEMARQNPHMDLGVHATLNSEWKHYRWGAVSTVDRSTGLLDADGYFHKTVEAVVEHASVEAVAAELATQVERVASAGVDITHIDSHMGTIMEPKFIEAYLQAGMSRLIPNMLPRASAKGFDTMGIDETALAAFAPYLNQLEAQQVPMLDGLFTMPLDHDKDHIGVAKQILGSAPAGISHFIFHPSIDTPELRAICSDWPARVANYKAFMSDEMKQFLQNEGIHLIGYHAIRDVIKKQ